MKTLFDQGDTSSNPKLKKNESGKYSMKIKAPVYEPKNKKPHILELCNNSKTSRLCDEIKRSNVSDEEKEFLIKAASRHSVFNYKKIADYYAHATPEMQSLMEASGLVIIDFKDAIKNGFVKVCKQIRSQYLSEYEK